jgi:hypothetical protein
VRKRERERIMVFNAIFNYISVIEFSIGFWNCSDSVVFFFFISFHYIIKEQTRVHVYLLSVIQRTDNTIARRNMITEQTRMSKMTTPRTSKIHGKIYKIQRMSHEL